MQLLLLLLKTEKVKIIQGKKLFSRNIQKCTTSYKRKLLFHVLNLDLNIFLINSGPCLRTSCSRQNQIKVRPVFHTLKMMMFSGNINCQKYSMDSICNHVLGTCQVQIILEKLNGTSALYWNIVILVSRSHTTGQAS